MSERESKDTLELGMDRETFEFHERDFGDDDDSERLPGRMINSGEHFGKIAVYGEDCDDVARLVVASAESYRRAFGANALAAAEGDALGAMRALVHDLAESWQRNGASPTQATCEFGRFAEKAREILSGALPAAPARHETEPEARALTADELEARFRAVTAPARESSEDGELLGEALESIEGLIGIIEFGYATSHRKRVLRQARAVLAKAARKGAGA